MRTKCSFNQNAIDLAAETNIIGAWTRNRIQENEGFNYREPEPIFVPSPRRLSISLEPQRIILFPNPSTGNFNISLPEGLKSENVDIRCHDITGKEIRLNHIIKNGNSITCNIEAASGTYQITLFNNGQSRPIFSETLVLK